MRIAIIGSGISGLTCAYYLSKHYQVSVFEGNDYLGGHTHTIMLPQDNDHQLSIDTGFIVFNAKTYPNFIKLLSELDVTYLPTEMSFSVYCANTGLEFASQNFRSFFAKPSSLLSYQKWCLLKGILRFNKFSRNWLKNHCDNQMTINHFLNHFGFSKQLKNYYVYPLTAAIWSMPIKKIQDFPALFLLKFLDNHGLLTLYKQPKWLIVANGSNQYIKALVNKSHAQFYCRSYVEKIIRQPDGVLLMINGTAIEFDKVIIATHSNQALALLDKPTNQEVNVLKRLSYQTNQVILHTDASLMPNTQRAWASWNYRILNNCDQEAIVTYDMNRLQCLKHLRQHYFISLKTHSSMIDPRKIIEVFSYEHPIYSLESHLAQQCWHTISGIKHTYYCGAYWQHGFHEDGVVSGLKVVKQLKEEN